MLLLEELMLMEFKQLYIGTLLKMERHTSIDQEELQELEQQVLLFHYFKRKIKENIIEFKKKLESDLKLATLT